MEYKSNLWTGIISLAVGVGLVLLHSMVATTLVVILGALFIFTGGMTLLLLVQRSKNPDVKKKVSFSSTVTALAATILGIWMILAPDDNVKLIITLFGIFVILGAGYQIFSMLFTYRMVKFPLTFYALPVIVLGTGLFMVFRPQAFVSLMVVLMGVVLIVFAVAQFMQIYAMSSYERALKNAARNPYTAPRPRPEETPYVEAQQPPKEIGNGSWPSDRR